MVAFDWYQATVRAPTEDVLEALLARSDRHELRHVRGVQGYATTTKLLSDDVGEVEVWHGGNHAYPHVRFTSEAAPGHAAILRQVFPDHSPTRIDVKEDFEGAGVFDRVLPALIDIAGRHRVKVDAQGDHYLTKIGRTLSLGSRRSAVMLRVYDKAAQMRAKVARDPVRLLAVPEHLTRLEVEVKPPSDAMVRRMMAAAEPAAFMGLSGVVRDAWEVFGGEPVAPMRVTKAWRVSDDDRSYAYLLAAFGPLLARRADEAGSWECLGLQLRDDLAAYAHAKRELDRR
jgi:hypothetical protein